MKQLPQLKAVPWLRDVLPDMLWLCSLISHEGGGTASMLLCVRLLDVVDEELQDERFEGTPPVIDGRLTQFEKVPPDARKRILDALFESGLYEQVIPERFAHALGMYPDAPGSWLIQPWRDGGLSIDPDSAQRFLSTVITESSHGQSDVPTKAKFISFSRYVNQGGSI
ncbi:MAG: hypothetical protein ABR505_01195 [Actinomycetota bacterium]